MFDRILNGRGLAMNKKILVVDDEPRVVNSLEVILSEKGYIVSKASSGKEAIELIRQDDFSIVIADLILPGMTGLELLKTVKKENPDLPVFIVTTFATINAAVIAMREGAEDFITKPILESEIRIKIERAIERYQVIKENARLRKEIEIRYSDERHGYISPPVRLGRAVTMSRRASITIVREKNNRS
jgi:DNA-binding NtrC family response regulator